MSIHIPVLLEPILEKLEIQAGQTIVDGTFGGGGHSKVFSETVGPSGRIIGFDRDPLAIEAAESWAPENMTLLAHNYADMPEVLSQLDIEAVDAILLDLGLSSDQLGDHDRGFSFHAKGPLDLRFNQEAGEPAYRLVNRLGEKHLADLIYEFGEERFSRRIARKIVKVRHDSPIKTASELADLVRSCVPRSKGHSIDPATRTFQALRIGVNEELKWLKVALKRLPQILKPGGKLAIISFHSLEDRMVKNAFDEHELLTVPKRKPIVADDIEKDANPRSRSAKLRVGVRV